MATLSHVERVEANRRPLPVVEQGDKALLVPAEDVQYPQ